MILLRPYHRLPFPYGGFGLRSAWLIGHQHHYYARSGNPPVLSCGTTIPTFFPLRSHVSFSFSNRKISIIAPIGRMLGCLLWNTSRRTLLGIIVPTLKCQLVNLYWFLRSIASSAQLFLVSSLRRICTRCRGTPAHFGFKSHLQVHAISSQVLDTLHSLEVILNQLSNADIRTYAISTRMVPR